MTDTPIRVVVADENRLYRRTICNSLSKEIHLQVVAEAEDGLAAIQAVQIHRPDVVLMDISMQVMNGLDAAWVIRSKFPSVRVILLSMIEADPTTETIRKAGACCCLHKECSPKEIIEAIMTAGI